MKESVDAVISWVDGNDVNHAKKISSYLQQSGLKKQAGAAPTRFNQCGEINYCVLSIFKYAPWIRKIYIITDNQSPKFANLSPLLLSKIHIVDHKDVFKDYEQNLPTFNSLSIESVLWRIEGLAEKFIYFNDDCFLIRPVEKEDFFRADKLVLRGYWKVQAHKRWRNYLPKVINKLLRVMPLKVEDHRNFQENAARLAGFQRAFFHLPHTPFPNFKKTFKDYFTQNPQHFINNIKFPIRNLEQFWPISLGLHLAIKNKDIIFDNYLKAVTINGAFHNFRKVSELFKRAENKSRVKFLCLQSLDITDEKLRKDMLNWLDNNI